MRAPFATAKGLFVAYYVEAKRRVTGLTALARTHAKRGEQAWVAGIECAIHELDRIFRGRIVPAVVAREAKDVKAEHGRAQFVVTLIEDRADRLVDRFETSIGEVQREVAALQTSAFGRTIFFVVVAPLLAVLVGVYVHRSVARPVARLQASATRLARGDLEMHIDVDAPYEFGALARQFNA